MVVDYSKWDHVDGASSDADSADARRPTITRLDKPSTDPKMTLCDAAEKGDLGRVRALLAQGVPVDERGGIGRTVTTDSMDFDREVEEASDDGWTALMWACSQASNFYKEREAQTDAAECVRALVDAGAAVSKVSKDGVTAR